MQFHAIAKYLSGYQICVVYSNRNVSKQSSNVNKCHIKPLNYILSLSRPNLQYFRFGGLGKLG